MEAKFKLKSTRLLLIIGLFVALTQQLFAVDIVGFTLATGTNGDATSGVAINYPGMGRNISAVGLNSVTFSSNGITGAEWDNNGTDGFKSNAFSTVGYLSCAVTGQIRGISTGPKYLKAQYSLNGTTWTDVPNHSAYIDDNPNITVTTSFASYKFRLPADCDNQSGVYVRLVQENTSSIGGGTVTTAGTISMKAVVIQAELLAPPTSQSTQITIVSLTPTTITVGCTPGSGNRRYIVINTTNSFTTPTNDYIATANSTYSGSGEQVIYVGSGTVATVTVPSSLNTYWFRYYEYNQLDLLTRYCTIDASASKNPKMCALPNIHTPTHDFGLIRATMGATIDPVSGDVGEIIDRGVFWDVNPGITNNTPNFVQHLTAASGTYTVNTFVDRGSTIYYRGYAENESGVILSAESSFNNRPVFSGTGTWETASLWNVNEVPGANGDVDYGSIDDSPTINGTCTLTASNNVTNLTINSSRKLTINPETTMKVEGTITNNGGTNGILIKSSPTQANGSLIFADGTPQASVEMYSKAYWNLANPVGSKYCWQYFGIPVTSLNYSGTFNNSYVRAWDESVIDYYDVWARTNSGTSLQLNSGSTLQPGVAYELCQQSNKTYTFTGTLSNADYNKTLQYSPTAYYKGQNMLSNPYTAAINIADLEFGANTVQAVYLYNTGTYSDWLSSNGENVPGSGPGTYTVSTPGTAGSGGVPSQIPSMQGYLVKATANPGSVSYVYSNLVANTAQQKSKSNVQKISTMIDLKGTTFSDRMWVFINDDCSVNFDNGFDGPKLLGFNEAAQLYGVGSNDIYQINALSDINEAVIGVQPGIETQLKLKFSHSNIDRKYSTLYLLDVVKNSTVDITAEGSEYNFTATASDPVNRFKIIGVEATTTDNTEVENNNVKFIYSGNKLIVDNKLNVSGSIKIFDTTARLFSEYTVHPESLTTVQPVLKQGVYIIKINIGTYESSKRVMIK